MNDFTNVRYLKFSAQDPWEAEFYNVVIDLVTDRIIDGIIKIGEEGEKCVIVNGKRAKYDFINPDYSIFAKVVDTGSYYLLDENMNVIFESHGYVPKLMDYYNTEPGFGDCIDIKIENLENGKLCHKNTSKINYNNPDDWTPVCKIPNLYAKGMFDTFAIIKNIITNSEDNNVAVANVLSTIHKYETNNIDEI